MSSNWHRSRSIILSPQFVQSYRQSFTIRRIFGRFNKIVETRQILIKVIRLRLTTVYIILNRSKQSIRIRLNIRRQPFTSSDGGSYLRPYHRPNSRSPFRTITTSLLGYPKKINHFRIPVDGQKFFYTQLIIFQRIIRIQHTRRDIIIFGNDTDWTAIATVFNCNIFR